MSKCLQCGEGSEWIEGKVPTKSRDDGIFDLRNEVERLRTIITELRIILDNDWDKHNQNKPTPDWEMIALSAADIKSGRYQLLDEFISELKIEDSEVSRKESNVTP
jgi:hypothetical protein